MYIEKFEFYSKYFCLLTDTFTDSAISKCNSNHTEGDLKVLQPWEGGEGDELGGLERESSVSTPPKGLANRCGIYLVENRLLNSWMKMFVLFNFRMVGIRMKCSEQMQRNLMYRQNMMIA